MEHVNYLMQHSEKKTLLAFLITLHKLTHFIHGGMIGWYVSLMRGLLFWAHCSNALITDFN